MGNVLIIKDADFSAVAVGKVPALVDISDQVERSSTGRMYYQNPQNDFDDAFRYNNTSLAAYNIGIVDIHEYVGKKIYFKNIGANLEGDYRCCFASSINTTFPPVSTDERIQNAVTSVEHLASVTDEYNIYTIPSGTVYLVFNEKLSDIGNAEILVESN